MIREHRWDLGGASPASGYRVASVGRAHALGTRLPG
jgi:hypothetical protein